jgi:RNA polymerase sigma-70 factor (ECF subfamily)
MLCSADMIDAIKQGDATAFEQAYITYRGKVHAYFLKKTNSAEDAGDLLQTVFLKLWQYRHSLSAEYLLEQHLFHIARTVFIDYLRRENKLARIKESIKVYSEGSPVNAPYEFDVHARLQKILSGMPPLRKKVFELHRIEGYSYKEIAEILSIPVKSVDNNLTKALKHLRNSSLFFILILAGIFS